MRTHLSPNFVFPIISTCRYANGTWHTQDPLWCSAIDPDNSRICSLQNNGQETFESSLWEYGLYIHPPVTPNPTSTKSPHSYVPHAQTSLISLYGGPKNFVSRLNYLHDRNITYIGNEPSFLTVYQYHWAGRPGLSAERVHFYIPRFFSTARDGLPGNDDSGAMGSFVAFSMYVHPQSTLLHFLFLLNFWTFGGNEDEDENGHMLTL